MEDRKKDWGDRSVQARMFTWKDIKSLLSTPSKPETKNVGSTANIGTDAGTQTPMWPTPKRLPPAPTRGRKPMPLPKPRMRTFVPLNHQTFEIISILRGINRRARQEEIMNHRCGGKNCKRVVLSPIQERQWDEWWCARCNSPGSN